MKVCQAESSSDPYLVKIRHRVVRGGREGEVNIGELQEITRR